jgi:hypothetical protein
MCPDNSELLKRIPPLSEMDVQSFTISEYLRLNTELRHQSDSDAYKLWMLLWIQDAMSSKREGVAHAATHILQSFKSKNITRHSAAAEVMQASLAKEEKLKTFYSSEWIRKTMRNVLVDRFLEHFFESILGSVLLLFAEGSPLVRARAMKTLNTLLRADPELSFKQEVKETITERLYDAAICVREETVKLIGGFVTQGFNIGDEYLDSLLARLRDTGVSVRKAVVGIVKEILIHQPNHPNYAHLCLCLLDISAQPKEEESVRDLIRSTFQQIWFLPPDTSVFLSISKPLKPLERKLEFSLSGVVDIGCLIRTGWKIINLCDAPAYEHDEGGHSEEEDRFLYVSPYGIQCNTFEEAVAAFNQTVEQTCGEESKLEPPPVEEMSMSYKATTTSAKPLLDIPISLRKQDAEESHLESTALQIVDVSNLLQDHSWVINVIRDTLYSKADGAGIPAAVVKRRQASLKHCNKLLKCLIELLIRCEEGISACSTFAEKQPLQRKLVSTVVAISLFCKSHPPLFLPYVHVLLPYLKSENNMAYSDECLLALCMTQMLEASACVEGFSLGTRNAEVFEDLTKIAFRLSNINIGAAVSCIAILVAYVTRDASTLLNLGERCFKLIQHAAVAINSSKTMQKEQLAKLQRFLIVLGYVCEHSRKCSELICDDHPQFLNLSEETYAIMPIASIDRFSASIMNAICYSAATFCMDLNDTTLQTRAAQAFCAVFTGNPKLILLANSSGLIKDLLGSQQTEDVHRTMLQSLKSMMLSEEARLESSALKETMAEAGQKLKAQRRAPTESDSDFTPAGFVLQDHLPRFIEFLTHSNIDIRMSSLELLGTLLRQGMLCPLDVMCPLIALQGDRDYKIRKDALKILQGEEQKHPNFFDNRLLDGVDMAYEVQATSFGQVSAVDEDGVSIFNALYTSSISGDRRRRTEFICGLLKKCLSFCMRVNDVLTQVNGIVDLLSLKEAAAALDRVAFYTTTLALLQYEIIDEPLLVVYWIGRNLPIASTLLTSIIKSTLTTSGSNVRIEGDMQGPAEGAVPLGYNKDGRTTSKSKVAMNEDGLIFNQSVYQMWVRTATPEDQKTVATKLLLGCVSWRCLDGLIRLKSYLKMLYAISDDKCISFAPDDKVGGEKAKCVEFMDPFELKTKDMLDPPLELLAQIDEKSLMGLVRLVTGDFNRFQICIDNEPEDFVMGKKKKRRRVAIDANVEAGLVMKSSSSRNTTLIAKRPVKKMKTMLTTFSSDDTSDDDSDDNESDSDAVSDD